MHALDVIAPAFVEMAHRIVWCTAATTNAAGRPTTRVLHPIWEWDGADLTGWIATAPGSPKARHLDDTPYLSLTYWDPTQDTATAECAVTWDDTPELRAAGWDRFASAPAPVGYDPRIVPPWTSPQAEAFGVLRLRPDLLRVLPGTAMVGGLGDLMTWKR